jgi:hypothetical protein
MRSLLQKRFLVFLGLFLAHGASIVHAGNQVTLVCSTEKGTEFMYHSRYVERDEAFRISSVNLRGIVTKFHIHISQQAAPTVSMLRTSHLWAQNPDTPTPLDVLHIDGARIAVAHEIDNGTEIFSLDLDTKLAVRAVVGSAGLSQGAAGLVSVQRCTTLPTGAAPSGGQHNQQPKPTP